MPANTAEKQQILRYIHAKFAALSANFKFTQAG